MTWALTALTVLAVALWPRTRPVPSPGRSGRGTSGARGDRVRIRCRRLWSAQVRPGRTEPGWVAEFAELSAVGLDAGLPAAEAARLACTVGATSVPVRGLGEILAQTEKDGHRVGDALRDAAGTNPDLAFLAAAWRLSEELGSATAPAARLAAEVLRERRASAERRAVLAAGPRASMWLLTLLPVTGPLVAMLLGLPVTRVYGTGVAGAAALVGLCLTAVGWLWSRRLLGRAIRPAVVS